jgi:hypothetical protein
MLECHSRDFMIGAKEGFFDNKRGIKGEYNGFVGVYKIESNIMHVVAPLHVCFEHSNLMK